MNATNEAVIIAQKMTAKAEELKPLIGPVIAWMKANGVRGVSIDNEEFFKEPIKVAIFMKQNGGGK